jgi:hypothetical protein
VARALAAGGSSGATLLLFGELLTAAGRYHEAEAAYRAAGHDPARTALALYRRARVMVRLDDPGAPEALASFAETYPADTAAPTALYLVGDFLADHGDSAGVRPMVGRAHPPLSRRSAIVVGALSAGGRRAPPRSARQRGAAVRGNRGGACRRVAARY